MILLIIIKQLQRLIIAITFSVPRVQFHLRQSLTKQTTVQLIFMMKEHVTQCTALTCWGDFNSFWIKTEVYSTEEYDTHAILVIRIN